MFDISYLPENKRESGGSLQPKNLDADWTANKKSQICTGKKRGPDNFARPNVVVSILAMMLYSFISVLNHSDSDENRIQIACPKTAQHLRTGYHEAFLL